MARRLEITVSEETWGRLEVARVHEPRASFVKRALESALGDCDDQSRVGRRHAEPVESEADGSPVHDRSSRPGGDVGLAPEPSASSRAPTVPGLVRASDLVVRGGCPECGGDPVVVDGVAYCSDCQARL